MRALLAAAAALALAASAQQVELVVCQGCHGMAGEGRPGAGYPPIAGQPVLYLERQLEAYADGRRPSAVMTPVARWLTPRQRQAFARHFAQQPLPAARGTDGGSVERGRVLVEVGDNDRRVQACANCHGPGGRGLAPSGPYLAGLDAEYMVRELRAWREGRRSSDPSGAMAVIARHLGDDDLAAVSRYYATLPR
jgi:cytochrome c553